MPLKIVQKVFQYFLHYNLKMDYYTNSSVQDVKYFQENKGGQKVKIGRKQYNYNNFRLKKWIISTKVINYI